MEQETMELVKFSVTDAAIAQMSAQYMPLTIAGLEDTKGFNLVHAARMVVKSKRVEVVKQGKALREDALKFQRAVSIEEKRIIGLLSPIEDHLQSEEDKVQAEKDRIKAEAEEKEKARIQARIDRLEDLGMVLSKGRYILIFDDSCSASPESIRDISYEVFEEFIQDVITAVAAEKERLANIEAARKAEEERLAEISMAQEEERKKLEEESRKQKEERDKIEAEKRALEAAKQKEIDDRVRAEEAEERARIQEELKPDKKKLLELADGIEAIHGPTTLQFESSKKVLEETLDNLKGVAKVLRMTVKEM